MEDIINKLAEIEAAASHIMEDVSEQKKQLAQQYEEAVQQFDFRHLCLLSSPLSCLGPQLPGSLRGHCCLPSVFQLVLQAVQGIQASSGVMVLTSTFFSSSSTSASVTVSNRDICSRSSSS